LGFAHGASGIAFALVRVGEYLRRERRPTGEVEASVRAYCEWLFSRFGGIEIPMYVYEHEGGSRYVPNGGGPSWCYGTAGQALLMFAAGDFLGDSTIIERGTDAALLSVERIASLGDNSLCHGLAGILAMVTVGHRVSEDPRLDRAEKLVRDRIVALYDSQSSFGFDYSPRNLRVAAPVPGLLNGATGVAIALWQSMEARGIGDGAPWLCPPSDLPN